MIYKIKFKCKCGKNVKVDASKKTPDEQNRVSRRVQCQGCGEEYDVKFNSPFQEWFEIFVLYKSGKQIKA